MKSFLIIVLFFIAAPCFSQLHKDNTIEIKYINPGVTTLVPVGYTTFDSAFASGMYNSEIIDNPARFTKLWDYYKSVTYSAETKPIDARYKISLYFSVYTKPVVIYMDYAYNAVDDGKLLSKSNFLKTLIHLVDATVYHKKY